MYFLTNTDIPSRRKKQLLNVQLSSRLEANLRRGFACLTSSKPDRPDQGVVPRSVTSRLLWHCTWSRINRI